MKRIAFPCLMLLVVCACTTDRPLRPGVSAEIVDANDAAGNQHFWWLAPISPQSVPSSEALSSKLKPIVTITDRCTGKELTTFSGSDLQISQAHFHVNWRTGDFDLTVGCEYRVAVLLGATELGHADIAVVGSGKEFKNAITNDDVPLLADRTLPIQFFIGVGSTCDPDGGGDCGEGTATPGENTLIVTRSGNAGVFIPAGAVNEETIITIQSVDDRSGEADDCIPGLPSQFPGERETTDNGCYEIRANPPLSQVAEEDGTFLNGVTATVGICPPAAAMDLDHETLDQIQIFRGDFGEGWSFFPLPNVEAPFLRCDPHFSPSFGSRRSLFDDLARAFASLVLPKPLYASGTKMVFDLGAGGSTDGFSRFTWALPFSER